MSPWNDVKKLESELAAMRVELAQAYWWVDYAAEAMESEIAGMPEPLSSDDDWRQSIERARAWLQRNEQFCDPVAAWNRRAAPDWANAPEWAEWWTMDAEGIVRWFRDEPYIFAAVWTGDGAYEQELICCDVPIGIDWRTLKVKRPNA